MKTVFTIIVSASLIYLAYAALLYHFQRKMIYPGAMFNYGESRNVQNRVFIESNGKRIDTRFYTPDSANAPLLIIAHGNASRVEDWEPLLKPALDMGLAVLLVEYPGYGASQGEASEENIAAAFETAYDHFSGHPAVDGSRVIAMGRSLGSGVVCNLSRTRPLKALLLISPFSSLKAFAPRYGLPAFLLKDIYDNEGALTQFDGPVFIVHGTMDEVIPVSHARRLRDFKNVLFYEEYVTRHNNTPPDWHHFWQDVQTFLFKNKIL